MPVPSLLCITSKESKQIKLRKRFTVVIEGTLATLGRRPTHRDEETSVPAAGKRDAHSSAPAPGDTRIFVHQCTNGTHRGCFLSGNSINVFVPDADLNATAVEISRRET